MLGCLIFTFVAFFFCVVIIRLHQGEKLLSKRKYKIYKSRQSNLMNDSNSLDDSSPDREASHKNNVKTFLAEHERHSVNKYSRPSRGNILEDHYRSIKTTQQHQKWIDSKKLDYILLWGFPATFSVFLVVYVIWFVIKVRK